MTDVALAIEALVPAAEYGGSVTANTEEAYNAIVWKDERPQPTWAEVIAAEPPAPAPTVTMRQARLALNAASLLDVVNAAIANADNVTKIYWETSPTVARDNEVLNAVGAGLGLTSEQIDALFALAKTL